LATDADPTSNREFQERVFGKMTIPETLPAFRSLKVDAMGWLWAELYEWDPTLPPKWMVFDLDGRARGTLTTPKGLVVESIGADYILGIWIDDLGIEFVRRYALNRGVVLGPSPTETSSRAKKGEMANDRGQGF
jgi:hypothetical protein